MENLKDVVSQIQIQLEESRYLQKQLETRLTSQIANEASRVEERYANIENMLSRLLAAPQLNNSVMPDEILKHMVTEIPKGDDDEVIVQDCSRDQAEHLEKHMPPHQSGGSEVQTQPPPDQLVVAPIDNLVMDTQEIKSQLEKDVIASDESKNEPSKDILVWKQHKIDYLTWGLDRCGNYYSFSSSFSFDCYISWDWKRKTCAKSRCEIPKILKFSFQLEPKNYTPTYISIGPYHHGSDAYSAIEIYKQTFFNYLLERSPWSVQVGKCLRVLVEIEHEIRACFTSEVSMSLKEFLIMILFDAAFIYCYFNGRQEPDMSERRCDYRTAFKNLLEEKRVIRDLLLLENQLPFQAIEKINDLFRIKDPILEKELFQKRIASELSSCLHHYAYMLPFKDSELPTEYDHLLHLCHIMLKPVGSRNSSMLDPQPNTRPQTAVQYYNKWVKLKKRTLREDGAHSILDISFAKGILEIPVLHLDEFTVTMLHNLVLFEQLSKGSNCYVSAYVEFICGLIRTREDITLLSKKGIIINSFGDDEEMIEELNCLYKSFPRLSGRGCYLDPLYASLEKYFKLNCLHKSFSRLSGMGCYLHPLYTSLEKCCNKKLLFKSLLCKGG